MILPPGDICQSLETHLVVTTRLVSPLLWRISLDCMGAVLPKAMAPSQCPTWGTVSSSFASRRDQLCYCLCYRDPMGPAWSQFPPRQQPLQFLFSYLFLLPTGPFYWKHSLNKSYESISEILLLGNLTYDLTIPALWFSICKLHVEIPSVL